jgi:glycerol kinase
MTHYVAAVDQGTTSTRCIIFDHVGQVVSMASREHAQIYPRPGWVEHDPKEIYENTVQVVLTALSEAGLNAGDLAGLGIANQRETTVIWNRRTGEPLGNAIVWQDARTHQIVATMAADGGQNRYQHKTGLPLSTEFSAPKIRWILDQQTSTPEADLLFGTIDTWLVWNLTGGPDGGLHITDVSNASRTLLMDLGSQEWDDEILDDFAIARSLLPDIRSSSEVYGEATGQLQGVPIASCLGDAHAALLGQACFDPGDVKVTLGTAANVDMSTGTQIVRSSNGLITTVAYKIGDEATVYCLEGAIAIAGGLVSWARDTLRLGRSAQEIEDLAASVADSGGAYIVPAFNGLYAPHWRDEARGVIAGLSAYVTPAHLARAALEASAWQTLDVLLAMQADAGVEMSALRVDGGMAHNAGLMQFQADVAQIPVIRPAIAEASCLGAAYAAGIAVGFWASLDEVRAMWKSDQTWTPSLTPDDVKKPHALWRKAVRSTYGWLDD